MALNEAAQAFELDPPVQLETDFARSFRTTYGADKQIVLGKITLDSVELPPVVKARVAFEEAEGPISNVEMRVEELAEAIDFTKVDAKTLDLAQIAMKNFASAVNFGGVLKSNSIIKN